MPDQDVRITPAGATVLTNCPNCGAAITADAKFCSNCGSRTQQFAVFPTPAPEGGEDPAVSTPAGETVTPQIAGVSIPPEPGAAPVSGIIARLSAELAGRYTITRELGRGGMATVFLAKDEKHGRDVAIKVLHPELSASIGGERFEREIRLVAGLQHPNVLGLYDSGQANGLLYYVMPFVDGESLRDKLNREGQLSVDDALRITLDVASALGYAHGKGIIHRDIKPENILLSGELTLVADFGIAKAASEASQQKLTQTGMAVGTPLYMAPEQAGGETVGPTADIYSLGCMLYEMLAGEPPFTGKNPVAIMARHAMEQVPSIRIVRSSVPPEVEETIFAAMGKVPADRPQTAAQFAELLGMPLASSGTMRVRGRTMSYPAIAALRQPWWKRKAVLAAVPALGVIVAGGAWYGVSARNSGTAVLGPEARRIAVLYFQDQSRDNRLRPLADGLTEELIRALGTSPSLTVVSPGGVEPYRSTTIPVDSIARILRVGFLVRGEVEPEGEQVRVAIRLDDKSGANVRRASFVGSASNLLGLQDTVALVAAELIKTQLHEEITLRQRQSTTSSTAAWLLVQRGELARKQAEDLAARGDANGSSRSFALADSLLAEAEAVDRRWVEPIVLRGSVAWKRARLAGDAGNATQVRQWVGAGLQHVERALQLDRRSADALELRGNFRYFAWLFGLETEKARSDALLAGAREDLEAAVALNPRQAGAHATLSHLYNQVGNTTDVYLAAQKAMEADEFLTNADVILSRLFYAAYDLGQFDRADQWCGEIRRRFSSQVDAVNCQLFMLTTRAKQPDVDLAWRLADSVVAVAPAPAKPFETLASRMLVAAVLARATRDRPQLADSAARLIRSSESDRTTDPDREVSLYGAFAYLQLGDKDNALRLLKEYLSSNPGRTASFRDEPGWWFRDLSTDPGFRQLVGLPA